MANTSKINGFRPVKHGNGSPYNGQSNIYYVASAGDEILVGDIVKLGGSADANGIASVDLCGASAVPIGVVVAIINPKLDPAGKMSTGSIVLDLPAATQIAVGAAGYVLVADAPDIIMEAEASGTPAVTDIGLNISHTDGSRTSATVTSPAYLNLATAATTATLNFRLLGFVQRVDNEVGASAKMLCGFNVHQFGSVGTTGI